MLAALAWRNIWRQPHRTALSLASIIVASAVTIFLLALQQGAYGTMEESVLRLLDGFAQAQPGGYADDPDLNKTIAKPETAIARLKEIKAVTVAAPRASTYVILSNGDRSFGSAVFGVDPSAEEKLSTLAGTVKEGRYLGPDDENAAFVGAGLARNLKISTGDKITMLGGARDRSIAADVLTVVGVFSTGSPEIDRQVIEMPLTRFQSDFAMDGGANVVAVGGRSLADIQAVLPALRKAAAEIGLTMRDWTELEPALHDVILLDASFSALLYVSLVVIVVFIILNTLLMSVLERTREFGMLMAIGMRPNQIGAMIWMELLFLAVVGAVIGVAFGAGLTAWFAGRGIAFPDAEILFRQWNMPSTLYPDLNWRSALAGPTAIMLSIVFAGVIPYLRVRGLEPVSAMRAV
ncbi:MAG: FtsX-like permease family protein [Alphaproteobacteria bacterium]|nr:FtsX-like permease family protein [Alphaproteobacteria bacterium]